ncbi:MAG TPA: PAS domain S-box protein, partial [Opitutaceae bacterium]|nr:PAS domain S-box protein [Opitutaceae bacterium]
MKRILIVDDLEENRYLLEATLRGYGYEVVSAPDGAEALAAARTQPPDLVISDILMPVMDGFSLCRQWRADERLRRIPFIFYTATYTDPKDEQLALDLGADRFVLKPQEPQVMREIVRAVLASGAKTAGAARVLPDEIVTLREYNEVLVRKLEKKLTELETAHQQLVADVRLREETEASLRQSENRWRLIIETEPECVKLLDANGTLCQMNPAGLMMLEADSFGQVANQCVYPLIAPEHRAQFQELTERVFRGESGTLEFQITGLKGAHRWLETHATPLRDEAGTVVSLLGVTRDITGRKESEALLACQMKVMEMIASSAPLPATLDTILRSMEGHTPDLLCSILLLDADGAYLRHGGAPSLPADYLRAIDGVAIGPCVGSCGTAAFRGEAVIVEDIATDPLWADYRELALAHGLHACWSTPIFDEQRQVLGTFAIYCRQPGPPNERHRRCVDIATHLSAIAIQRHRDEAALWAKTEELEGYFSNSLDLLCIADTDGFFRRLNPEWERTLGYPLAELAGRRFLDFVHPDDLGATLDALHTLSSRERVLNFVNRYRHHDGSYRWIEWRSYAENKIIYAAARDVTERKQAEAERQKFISLADSSREFIGMCDREFKPFYVNAAGLRLVGLPDLEAACRIRVQDCFFPEDQPFIIHEFFPRVLREGHGDVEIRFRHFQTGAPIWMLYNLFNIRDASGEVVGWATVSRDITARKEAEATLRESEARYRTLFEAMDEGFCVIEMLYDPAGQPVDYRFLEINPAFEKQTGLTHALGKTIRELVPDHDAPWFEIYGKVARTGEGIRFENPATAMQRFYDVYAFRVGGEGSHRVGVLFKDITERKRSEEQLRQREQRLSALIRNLPGVAFRVRNDPSYTVEYISDQIAELTGYPADDFRANRRNFGELMHPDDRERVWNETQQALGEHRPYEVTYRFMDAHGRERWNWERGTGIYAANGELQAIEGFVQDITARKEAEAALRESERSLTEAQRIAHVGSWSWNLAGPAQFTDELYRMYGVSRETFTPTVEAFFDVVYPEDRPTMQEWLRACGAGESPAEFEFRAIRPDGTVRLVSGRGELVCDAAGRPIRMVGTAQDITERKQAEEALRESAALLQSVTEGTSDAVYVKDTQGRYLMFNTAASRIVGRPSAEILGKDDTAFFSPDEASAVMEGDRRVLASGGTQTYEEFMTIGGVGRTFLTAKGPVRDAQGQVVGLFGIARDISERKEAEAALRESEARVRSVFEQASDGIYVITAENRYLQANARGLELLGYTRNELLEMSVADVLAPHEVARLAVEPPRMMSGAPHLAEWEHVRKDGSTFPGEVSARRLDDHSYLAIVRD